MQTKNLMENVNLYNCRIKLIFDVKSLDYLIVLHLYFLSAHII